MTRSSYRSDASSFGKLSSLSSNSFTSTALASSSPAFSGFISKEPTISDPAHSCSASPNLSSSSSRSRTFPAKEALGNQQTSSRFEASSSTFASTSGSSTLRDGDLDSSGPSMGSIPPSSTSTLISNNQTARSSLAFSAGPENPDQTLQRFQASNSTFSMGTSGSLAAVTSKVSFFTAPGASITKQPVRKVPSPISYGADSEPIYDASASLPDTYASGVQNLRWGMNNCSMGPGPNGNNAKSCSCRNRIEDWYHQYATDTITTEECLRSYDFRVATDVQSIGCSSVTATQLAQNYTAPAECCDRCEVTGKSIRLVYWPKPDAVPYNMTGKRAAEVSKRADGAVHGTVSDGFTFISPSVYVIYSNIAATASCVARIPSKVQIGPLHTAVTRAYAPDALSTARCLRANAAAGLAYCIHPVGQDPKPSECFQGKDIGYAQIDYEHLYNSPPLSKMLSEKQKCFDNTIKPGFAAMLYASPQLSFPPDVTEIDPLWATWGAGTCTPNYLGLSDPPRALGRATALGPLPDQAVTATAEFSPKPTPAQPGGQVNPAPKPTVGSKAFAHNHATALAAPVPAATQTSNPPKDPVPNDIPDPAPTTANQGSGRPKDISSSHNNQDTPATQQSSDQQAQGGASQQASGSFAVTVRTTAGNVPFVNPPPQVGSQNVQKQANGNVIVGGMTIPEGQQATVDGHGVFNAPDHVVVDEATNTLAPLPVTVAVPPSAPSPGSNKNIAFVNPPPHVDSQTVQKQANGNVVVGNSIVPEGQQATVDGHALFNAPDHVVVDGLTHALAPTPVFADSSAPFLQDNQVVQVSNNGLQIAGQTFVPGSQASVQGHDLNYEKPGLVIIDGTTKSLSPISTANPLVIGTQTLSRAANGGVLVSGQTVAPGAPVIANEQTYDMAGDSSIIANGQTYALPPTKNAYLVQAIPTDSAYTSHLPEPVTLSNGLILPPQPAAPSCSSSCAPIYNLPDGATLSAGGSAAILSGTTLSLLPSSDGGGLLVNGASTLSIPTPTITAANLDNQNSVFTIASRPFTAAPSGFTLPYGSATITPGAPAITVSGTRISLDQSGTLVLGSHTVGLSPPQFIFSLGDGRAFTAQATGFVIAPGTTVMAGGEAKTVGGEVVSLGVDGVLAVGGKAVVTLKHVSPAATSAAATGIATSAPLGPAVLSGLHGEERAAPSPTKSHSSGAAVVGGRSWSAGMVWAITMVIGFEIRWL